MLLVLLVTVTGTYAVLCGLLFGLQRRVLFPAPMTARPPRGAARLIDIDGGPLLAWSPPSNEAAPVVVHFHGNAEQLADTEWLAEQLVQRGLGFLAVEYPGYGLRQSAGSPSEGALVEAGEQSLRYVTDALAVDRSRIVLSGQSIGTGVAVELAARGWGTRVLLVSPYTALPDVAARILPFVPVRLLMLDRFDSLSRAKDVRQPVLVIHGVRDEVIPFELGKALSRAFPTARLVRVEEAHHNDIWEGPGVLSEAVTFLERRPP